MGMSGYYIGEVERVRSEYIEIAQALGFLSAEFEPDLHEQIVAKAKRLFNLEQRLDAEELGHDT